MLNQLRYFKETPTIPNSAIKIVVFFLLQISSNVHGRTKIKLIVCERLGLKFLKIIKTSMINVYDVINMRFNKILQKSKFHFFGKLIDQNRKFVIYRWNMDDLLGRCGYGSLWSLSEVRKFTMDSKFSFHNISGSDNGKLLCLGSNWSEGKGEGRCGCFEPVISW